jgi:hemoglobin|nr:group 1 truncated hemoglobin [Kofleriaceae bacterium]
MAMMRTILISLALGAAACGGGHKGGDTMSNSGGGSAKSLYDRLGGKDAITAVVGDFLTNVAADPVISARFTNANIPELKQKLVDQICQAAGGPCTYTGKKMVDAHAGMGIKEEEFNALVGDLKKSLDKFKVGAQEQTDLLTALGGMKGDIVGH